MKYDCACCTVALLEPRLYVPKNDRLIEYWNAIIADKANSYASPIPDNTHWLFARQAQMTIINFKCSGSLRGWKTHVTIDLDRLTPREADHLLLLIDKADFFKLPRLFIGRPVEDDFRYRITVETDTKCHSVRFSESTVPETLRPLLEDLSTLAVVV